MDERTIIFTRVYDSPRGILFDMWTDPALFSRWWSPKDFSNTICEIGLRAGAWRTVMRSPEGIEYPLNGVYRTVIMPERIVIACHVRDNPAARQEVLPQSQNAAHAEPTMELTIAVTLEEQAGQTKLTVCNEFPDSAGRDAYVEIGMKTTWNQTLDRLADAVANKLSANRKSFVIQTTLSAERKFGFTSGEHDASERFQQLAIDTYDFLTSMGADFVLFFDPWPESAGNPSRGAGWGKRARRSLVPDEPSSAPDLRRIELSPALLDRWQSWNREYYEVRGRNARLELRDMMQDMSESHNASSFPDELMELRIRDWIDAGDSTALPPFEDRRAVATPEFFNRLRELRKLLPEWPFG